MSAIAYEICADCIKAVLSFISSLRGSPLNGVNSTRSKIPAEPSFIPRQVFSIQEKGKSREVKSVSRKDWPDFVRWSPIIDRLVTLTKQLISSIGRAFGKIWGK